MSLIFMDSRFRGNDRKRLYGEFLKVPLWFVREGTIIMPCYS